MSRDRTTIVRGERLRHRSRGGRRAVGRLRGLLHYIAYGHYHDRLGRDTPQQRGIWLAPDGKRQPHADVLAWAKSKVQRLGYETSYQLLLSTRDGGLDAADFAQVLHAGSAISGVRDWRLMTHDDSAHQHAHVILFRHTPLSVADYKRWQQTMQTELDRLQAEQVRQRELTLDGPKQAAGYDV